MMFSIIMPTYKNTPHTLTKAISSVIKQEEKDWELLIIDDNFAGTDFKAYSDSIKNLVNDQRVKVYLHQSNMGANAARNTGIKNSSGTHLAFLDADDEWDKDYLLSVKNIFKEYDVGLVSSAYRLVTNNKTFDVYENRECSGYIYMKMIYKDIVGPTSAVVVDKKILLDAGGFDENLPARQDYDMWLRITKLCNVASIHKAKLSIYRRGTESISSRGMNHINGTDIVIEKLLKNPKLLPFKTKVLKSHYSESSYYALRQKNYKVSRVYAIKALKNGFSFKNIGYILMSFCPKMIEMMRKVYRKVRS
ncbi:glycosyltransferase family A protein [Sporolactobacillus sp. STCC-11]|uniref:glycosyltransferase family 2 protein n=1 Tax=Sporolactobacillus caesalpiniae TaxID=3230362 RepID=UPI00339483DA